MANMNNTLFYLNVYNYWFYKQPYMLMEIQFQLMGRLASHFDISANGQLNIRLPIARDPVYGGTISTVIVLVNHISNVN